MIGVKRKVFLFAAAACVVVAHAIAGIAAGQSVGANQAVDAPRPLQSASPQAETAPKTIEELTRAVKESVVVISFSGRDGRRLGIGSGFVIDPDGLVATNLHVIGEARPIEVRTSAGKSYTVTSIHATDRAMDLAVLRVDARGLPALPLGDSETLEQGERIITVGNPQGLTHSVVNGIVSGRRDIDGRPMIQLAMPIEKGNSGGPVLDMQGRVRGILTLKSLVTRNLGFAVAIDALGPLLAEPNPVPIARWLTIGALDFREWTTPFGAQWRQRAGRIHVEGTGDGFGGRALAISSLQPPEETCEIAVNVRLDDEAGAAGLVFHSDGGQKHYGFYPSNGRLRLSRFDGPDVYSWKVLEEVAADEYRPGEWNHLKVCLNDGKIACYVNDKLVIESADAVYTSGRAGLAKFRDTRAEFKGFAVAEHIPLTRPPAELAASIQALVADIPTDEPPKQELIEQVRSHATAANLVLRERARELEQRSLRLRQLADAVHQQQVRDELAALLKEPEDQFDLLRAALLIARLDNDEVDVDAYVREVDRMAGELKESLSSDADESTRLAALNRYLFEELGFHGSRTDYYNRSNSYLNEVIDDREGLPITLSVLYMELGRRIGLKIVGVGLPGHFVVRLEPANGEARIIDPFDRGQELSREQAGEKVRSVTGQPPTDEQMSAQPASTIITRMLSNLFNVAREEADAEAMLRYVDALLAVEPVASPQRWARAVLNYQTGRIEAAIRDADWLLERESDDQSVNLEHVRQLRRILERTP